ncbi:MAG: TetR/AcrR family transcriptional regulator [Spirochaetales bacterium]|nr:TetR/AcrR family transcriptional regulator [Spirochaetales bacterium]
MDETKEKILSAALDLFSEKGFTAVSTRSIAEAAQVNEVTLFRSFGTKRELYIELFHRFSMKPENIKFPSFSVDQFHDDIKELLLEIAHLFLCNIKIIRMSIKDMKKFPEIGEVLQKQPKVLITMLGKYFHSAKKEYELAEEPDSLAEIMIVSLMGSVVHLQHYQDDQKTLDFVSRYIKVLLKSISRKKAQ